MPGRLFPYDVRSEEPWVGPSRGCSCSPRWRDSITGTKTRLCSRRGKPYVLKVMRVYKQWGALVDPYHARTGKLRGQIIWRTGFRSEAAAKAWATEAFYRLCQGKTS